MLCESIISNVNGIAKLRDYSYFINVYLTNRLILLYNSSATNSRKYGNKLPNPFRWLPSLWAAVYWLRVVWTWSWNTYLCAATMTFEIQCPCVEQEGEKQLDTKSWCNNLSSGYLPLGLRYNSYVCRLFIRCWACVIMTTLVPAAKQYT